MTDTRTDETVIRNVLDDEAKALYAKDADAMVAHYANDIVICNLAPPLCRKSADARDTAGLKEWFATWKGPIGRETRDLHIETGGDIAFAYCFNRMSGTKRGGEAADLWTRSTIVFARKTATGRSCTTTTPCLSSWIKAFARQPI